MCLCGQGTKGHTGASGLMGPPGPPGAQGRPGPPGPPSTGAQTDYCLRCNTVVTVTLHHAACFHARVVFCRSFFSWGKGGHGPSRSTRSLRM